MKEIWLPVLGYEGIYEVSNLSRIKSLSRVCFRGLAGKCVLSEKILKPYSSRGYYYVKLSKDNIEKVFLIHRLSAIAFIPNPNKYLCINHINGNKADNRIENLEWCTYAQNTHHAVNTGLVVTKKLIDKVTGNIYNSTREAAIALNVNYKTLSCRLSGHMKNNTNLKYL